MDWLFYDQNLNNEHSGLSRKTIKMSSTINLIHFSTFLDKCLDIIGWKKIHIPWGWRLSRLVLLGTLILHQPYFYVFLVKRWLLPIHLFACFISYLFLSRLSCLCLSVPCVMLYLSLNLTLPVSVSPNHMVSQFLCLSVSLPVSISPYLMLALSYSWISAFIRVFASFLKSFSFFCF